ncbi:hypothetical protein NHQ30_003097 [Ciborinia camelliae]|nr:hypothetical protein NHQ30_003097 [Ciborinia camelliae]
MLCLRCSHSLRATPIISRALSQSSSILVKRTFTSITPLRPTLSPSAFKPTSSLVIASEAAPLDLLPKISTHPALSTTQLRLPTKVANEENAGRNRGVVVEYDEEDEGDEGSDDVHDARHKDGSNGATVAVPVDFDLHEVFTTIVLIILTFPIFLSQTHQVATNMAFGSNGHRRAGGDYTRDNYRRTGPDGKITETIDLYADTRISNNSSINSVTSVAMAHDHPQDLQDSYGK